MSDVADLWVSVHEGVNGPKLLAFAEEAGCSENEALGILVRIWLWAMKNGNTDSDGMIRGRKLRHVEEAYYFGLSENLDHHKVSEALVKTGWIDDVNGSLFIHDWPDHQEYWIKHTGSLAKDAERKRRERAELKARKAAEEIAQGSGLGESAQPVGQESPGPQPQPQTTSSVTKYSKAFEEFWEAYPRKEEKASAYKCYQARLKDGYSKSELLEAARAYAVQCRRNGTEKKYTKQAKTFLGPNTPFVDFLQKLPQERPEAQMPDLSNPFAEYGDGE